MSEYQDQRDNPAEFRRLVRELFKQPVLDSSKVMDFEKALSEHPDYLTPVETERIFALIKSHPLGLSNLETIEFLKKKIYMGIPERIAKPKRGKQSRKTQYNLAYERRKGLYYRLAILHSNGSAGMVKKGKRTVSVIERALSEAPTWVKDGNPHKINKWISEWLVNKNLAPRHRSTIFRALVKIASNRNATK